MVGLQNSAVGIAQIIFRTTDDPGGRRIRICVVPGIAGPVEPVSVTPPGGITPDNTVTWASLGETSITNAPNWSPHLLFRWANHSVAEQGVDYNIGDFTDVPGQTSYYLCTARANQRCLYAILVYPREDVQSEPTPAPRIIDYIAPTCLLDRHGRTITDVP